MSYDDDKARELLNQCDPNDTLQEHRPTVLALMAITRVLLEISDTLECLLERMEPRR